MDEQQRQQNQQKMYPTYDQRKQQQDQKKQQTQQLNIGIPNIMELGRPPTNPMAILFLLYPPSQLNPTIHLIKPRHPKGNTTANIAQIRNDHFQYRRIQYRKYH